MDYSKYINSLLDEEYKVNPGDFIEEGSLPKEEMEVRYCLMAVKVALDKVSQYGYFSHVLKTRNYRMATDLLKQYEENLMITVNKSPIHKAAVRRIVNAMPINNGGRDILLRYTR